MPSDTKILQMFLNDMSHIKLLDEKQEKEYEARLLSGDQDAGKRLIETHLKMAIGLVQDFTHKDVNVQDLIGEANLALVDTIYGYEGGDLRTQIEANVKEALESFCKECSDAKISETVIVDRANMLTEVTVELAESLGRQPTSAEIAHRMLITEEEVETLIEMTMNALENHRRAF